MRMLSMRVGELMHKVRVRARSVHAPVPDTYAQSVHKGKGRSMHVRKSKFLIICKVPKTAKKFKSLLTLTNRSSKKNFFLALTEKKSS